MTRRTAKSQALIDAILQVFQKYKPPLTVRQIYYQLASVGLVPLSQQGYRQAQRLLLEVRERGVVPWAYFADRTRRRIQPAQWNGLADFADSVSRQYRRDLWQSQPEHVEFWLEKDAMAGFVGEVLHGYGVPLYVARGFSSATFIYEAAGALAEVNKPICIYYLGDHDPSGMAIEQSLISRLKEFGVDAAFSRLAITLDDIDTFALKPLQAKKSDTRYRGYVAEHGTATVELDALPPDELRRRIVSAVESHINVTDWNNLLRTEKLERETFVGLAERIRGAGGEHG